MSLGYWFGSSLIGMGLYFFLERGGGEGRGRGEGEEEGVKRKGNRFLQNEKRNGTKCIILRCILFFLCWVWFLVFGRKSKFFSRDEMRYWFGNF